MIFYQLIVKSLTKCYKYNHVIKISFLLYVIPIINTIDTKTTTLNAPTINQDHYFNLTKCYINLADNVSAFTLNQQFLANTSSGLTYMVSFKFKIKNSSNNTNYIPFSLKGEDTFMTNLWIWAAGRGKNLLRLPTDHSILSLGLLTIQSSEMKIVLDYETSYRCFEQVGSYSYLVHKIAKFLSENITGNGSINSQDMSGPVVCRSVYAFTHFIYGTKGVGYKCCIPPNGLTQIQYQCDQPYSDSYELVWYGPIALMCFIYVIGLIHFFRLYNKNLDKVKIRELSGVDKTIDEIKQDIVERIVKMSSRLVRINNPNALISLRERCGFLDILGIGKANHSNIVFGMRVIFVAVLFISYYVVWGIFLYIYKNKIGKMIGNFNSSDAVFLNVVGHAGWLFANPNLGIFTYAIVEVIYSAIIPLLAIILYLSFIYKKKTVGLFDPTSHEMKGWKIYFYRFCASTPGNCIQLLSLFLFFLYMICLGGVFISYLVYFVGLGIFANIDVVSPWVIPIIICFHFFSTSFDPAYAKYKTVKDSLFTICYEDFRELVIKKDKELFLPRDLIENFYIPNSRSIIYSCFLRVVWIFTFLFLVILIVLTLQYPYSNKLSSLVPFLGVQVVFVLPLIAKVMAVSNQTTPLEDTVLKRDLKDYIKKYKIDDPNKANIFPLVNSNTNEDFLKSEDYNNKKSPFSGGDARELGDFDIQNDVTFNSDPLIESSKNYLKNRQQNILASIS